MSKTGLAKISGGVYRISDCEGRAIASFVPPPLLKNLEWESLSSSQQWLFEEFTANWEIIAHWLVYFRTRAVDIKDMPFTLPEVLDKRELAELYSSQLDLCAAVWEAIEIRHRYPTPYDWWKDCMVELQQALMDLILASGGYERTTPLKGEIEDGLRRFVNDLKKDDIPFTKSTKNQHLYTLYDASIKFKNKSSIEENSENLKRVKDAWREYLEKFRLYIKAIKNNRGTKAVVHLSWRLYYQGEKNHLIPIFAQPSSDKHTVLETRAKVALLSK